MSSFRRFAWPLVVVLSFAAGIAWHVATAQDAKPKTSQRWDYQHLVNNNVRDLERAGLEGWELVTVTYDQHNQKEFYLKRPK